MRRLLAISVLIVVIHTGFALLLSGQGSLADAYRNLSHWDTDWYAQIVEHGYRSDIPPQPQKFSSNVAFPPGYPIAIWVVQALIGFSTAVAAPIAAQLAAVVFWFYFLLTLGLLRISLASQVLAVVLVLSFPSAFYLVMGYSESLFLANVLGMLYWLLRGSSLQAFVHGFLASATRLVGVGGLSFLVGGFLERRREWRPYVFVSAACILGMASFLLFCQLRFGQWDLYFETVLTGWKLKPNPLAILTPSYYDVFRMPHFEYAQSFARPLMLLYTVGFFWFGYLCQRERSWGVSLFLFAFSLYYLPFTSHADWAPGSMLRYLLPVHVLIVILFFNFYLKSWSLKSRRSWIAIFWVIGILLGMFWIQARFLMRFTHGEWVA